jgi:hypothetical protein
LVVVTVPFVDAAINESVLDALKSKLAGKPPYPVLEPGYWVKAGPTHRLVDWIDNNRVIFVGGSFEHWDHNKLNPTAIYTYDIRSKAVIKLADGITYCFKPTEIRYTLKQSPEVVVGRTIKRNSPDPEIDVTRTRAEIEAESQKARTRGFIDQPLYCGGFSPREMAGDNWEKYQLVRIFPLLEGHGYLDLFGTHPNLKEPPFDTEPVRWFPPNGGAPINLPMPKRAVKGYQIEYSEWKNAYILRGSGRLPPPQYELTAKDQRWPTGKPFPVWLLNFDGSIETLEIPYSSWIGNYGRILLSHVGFVVTRDINTREAGLYLVVRKDLVRLVAGGTVGVAVSPDGCKVAVAITTDFNNRNGGLKVVNVCEGKGR